MAVIAGKAAHTSRDRPANMSFFRPVASIAAATFGSSQAFTLLRSMIFVSGRADASSGKVGPHMLSRAVVVTTVGTFSVRIALASDTTLLLSSASGMSRTPDRRPTWWSTRTSAALSEVRGTYGVSFALMDDSLGLTALVAQSYRVDPRIRRLQIVNLSSNALDGRAARE